MSVHQVAFITVTTLGLATIGLGSATLLAGKSDRSRVEELAFSALTVLGASMSMAAMAAFASTLGRDRLGEDKSLENQSTSVGAYFQNFKIFTGYAMAGTVQLVAQIFGCTALDILFHKIKYI